MLMTRKKYHEFECPICHNTQYTVQYQEPVVLGGSNIIAYYACVGCTVIFEDPKKFSCIKRGQ